MFSKEFCFKNLNFKFQLFYLEHDVISCEEAAIAKKIPLKNELKSLLIHYDKGLCLVSVCGDNNVNLRNIKKILACRQAFMASKSELQILNLRPGTVCPFLEQTIDMLQLFDKRIFELEFLSTNNGNRNEYIKFPPTVLLKCNNYIIDDFCK